MICTCSGRQVVCDRQAAAACPSTSQHVQQKVTQLSLLLLLLLCFMLGWHW